MKVLIATDGSACARAAANLLKQLPLPKQLELKLLSVINGLPREFLEEIWREGETDTLLSRLGESLKQHTDQILATEKARFADSDWSVETLAREGHVAEQILEAAEELHVDLVAVGSRGLGVAKRFLLGSVSNQVVKHAPCSVLISPKQCESGVPAAQEEKQPEKAQGCRILVGFDGSPSAKAAIDTLASWPLDSQTHIGFVTVLTLITTYRQDILQQISAAWQEEKKAAESELQALEKRFKKLTPNVSVDLREGEDPSHELMEAAQEVGADLIVVGHKGQSAIERFVMGSVSTSVAHHAPCAVLLMRP